MVRRSVWLVTLLLLGLAPAGAAQFPGELWARVTDAETGTPVEAARVEIPSAGRAALSDATGTVRLRGLEPGRHRVVVRRLGYAEWVEEVEVRNGLSVRVPVVLRPRAVELEGVRVSAEARRGVPAVRIERSAIERSGARTVGDVVGRVPGVVLRGEGADRQQTVSIRGSGTDAVLVLVDGVPLNDPVTGTADLSTVPAELVETVTVLVGAQSARYGPRAEAGVVLVETRNPDRGVRARGGVGSLAERKVGAEVGHVLRGIGWSLGAHGRVVGGEFDYVRVPGIDDRRMRRSNADLREAGVFAAAHARAGGGELRARAGLEGLERGLPGKGYAPSEHARQELERARGSLSWRRTAGPSLLSAAVAAVDQRVRYSDPDPPFGNPYDATTRVRSLELRAEWERAADSPWLRAYGAGLEGHLQHVNSGSLSEQAPRSRTDAGAFAFGTTGAALRGELDLELTAEARVDRDAAAGRWYPNHALTARLTAGSLAAHLANRSGYSPPSLGDQFFREGVAVAPNPGLQAERIPAEWEAGLAASGRWRGLELGAGATLYQGDVRGMIVWLPDFRFVWSPRNTDVRRRGLEGWGELRWPAAGLRLGGSYSLAAVTYDRVGDADTVQVAYRPRHSAQLRAEWIRGAWRAGLGAVRMGTRYPAPAPLNPLPAFWTFDLDLGREWRFARGSLDSALHVDRLLNEKDSMIFGFPEAGRRVRLEARLRLADQP